MWTRTWHLTAQMDVNLVLKLPGQMNFSELSSLVLVCVLKMTPQTRGPIKNPIRCYNIQVFGHEKLVKDEMNVLGTDLSKTRPSSRNSYTNDAVAGVQRIRFGSVNELSPNWLSANNIGHWISIAIATIHALTHNRLLTTTRLTNDVMGATTDWH